MIRHVSDLFYEGADNPIIIRREFFKTFYCYFDLLWYPFDTQKCYANVTLLGQTAQHLGKFQ